jgi:hypothetical protein
LTRIPAGQPPRSEPALIAATGAAIIRRGSPRS